MTIPAVPRRALLQIRDRRRPLRPLGDQPRAKRRAQSSCSTRDCWRSSGSTSCTRSLNVRPARAPQRAAIRHGQHARHAAHPARQPARPDAVLRGRRFSAARPGLLRMQARISPTGRACAMPSSWPTTNYSAGVIDAVNTLYYNTRQQTTQPPPPGRSSGMPPPADASPFRPSPGTAAYAW